jgi:hypothetical protein
MTGRTKVSACIHDENCLKSPVLHGSYFFAGVLIPLTAKGMQNTSCRERGLSPAKEKKREGKTTKTGTWDLVLERSRMKA